MKTHMNNESETPAVGSELSAGLGAVHDSVCQTRGHDCEEVDHLWVAIRAWKEEEKLWKERELGLVAKIESLLPYIHHHKHCYKGGNDNATVIDCVCGLDAALSA